MSDEKNSFEITFAEGSFEDFDGTQEELDDIVKEITRFLQSVEFSEALSNAAESDDNEEFNPDLWEKFNKNNTRTIH